MKVLNICRFLPIEGFPAENDITLKIYADLKSQFGINSLFIMPLAYIPKWATYYKKSLINRYKTINDKNYIDKRHKIPIEFFQAFFPIPFIPSLRGKSEIYNILIQYLFYKKHVNKKVEKYQPDIIHAHTVFDAIYAYKIFKKFKIPYVITLRGSFSNVYKLKIIKKVLNNSKKLVTPSARLKRDLNELYNVELLPHGVDNEWYLNEEKHFNNTTLRIITVARLHDWKNIHTVIQSIANLINEGYNIRYSIVGEGYYEEYLKELVLKNRIQDYVIFYGFKSSEELRQLFRKNDIFILLSYPETFGRVYYEAAAQGLLLIGRKNTGIDGYFTTEEAFIIDPSIEETSRVLRTINKEIFLNMTNKSKLEIKSFKNDNIIYRYYQMIKLSCKN